MKNLVQPENIIIDDSNLCGKIVDRLVMFMELTRK